jgi:hypothetical protein
MTDWDRELDGTDDPSSGLPIVIVTPLAIPMRTLHPIRRSR